MKIKFLFLLPVLAIALATGLTNCAKENVSSLPVPDATASDRGPCDITITVNGNAEFCGTQTNANYCANVMNANQYGVENVTAGTYTYTNIAAPSYISVNNPGLGSIKVSITTSGGAVSNFLLAGGASRMFFLTGTCQLI